MDGMSLWVTSAYAGRLPLDRALVAAAAELDHVSGAERVQDWSTLGERVVAVALPRAGATASVPRGNPEGVTRFEDVTRKNLRMAVLSGAVEKDSSRRISW